MIFIEECKLVLVDLQKTQSSYGDLCHNIKDNTTFEALYDDLDMELISVVEPCIISIDTKLEGFPMYDFERRGIYSELYPWAHGAPVLVEPKQMAWVYTTKPTSTNWRDGYLDFLTSAYINQILKNDGVCWLESNPFSKVNYINSTVLTGAKAVIHITKPEITK
jgi:hypothetical protein